MPQISWLLPAPPLEEAVTQKMPWAAIFPPMTVIFPSYPHWWPPSCYLNSSCPRHPLCYVATVCVCAKSL